MTNQNQNLEPITQQDWEELVNFIGDTVATKDDLAQLKRDLASELKHDLSSIFATREDIRTELEKAVEKLLASNNSVLQSNDKLIQRLEGYLTEHSAMKGGLKRHDETFNVHAARMARVEQQLGNLLN